MPTLADLIVSRRKHFDALAAAWLSAGATTFSIWTDDRLLRRWPPDVALHDIQTTAHITSSDKLCVDGVNSSAMQTRLDADAALIGEMLVLERELQEMTAELISYQDQLLALYALTQSLRSHLTVEATLHSLARAAMRLLDAQAAFALLDNRASVMLAQYPDATVECSILLSFFQRARSSTQVLTVYADDDADALPAGIDNLLLRPISVRDEISAGLGLINKPGRFDAPDLKLVDAIAEQAGAQIENLLLYEENLEQARLQTEMDLARNVQTRLLPRSAPHILGLDMDGRSRAALQVGGDFFDFIVRPKQPFRFVIGDVAGKGLSAALLMAMTRVTIQGRALESVTPQMMISRSNEDLYDDLTEVGLMVTAFIGQYDCATRRLVYANAGHSPVIYRPIDGRARMLEADGTALGVLLESFAEDHTLIFRPGDVFIAATDGFSEASDPSGAPFGYDALLRLVDTLADRAARDIADALFAEMDRFSAGHTQGDDQTLIVIKGVEA